MNAPSFDTKPKYGMRNALRLVLLYCTSGTWDEDRRNEWRRLTGDSVISLKVLSHHTRLALAVGCAGDAGEGERLYGWRAGRVLTERDVEDLSNLLADRNDELGEVEQYHLGRTQAFFEIGGQKLVDEKQAADLRIVNDAVREALERYKDMGGRGL